MTANELAQKILKEIPENDVHSRMEEVIPEYLNDDWEDEFDDMYEAYDETGRREASTQVIQEILMKYGLTQQNDLDKYIAVADILKDEWCIN